MPSLNLGIVAHVDAGKTSLTERLLFEAGAVDALGSVDAGTTATDSMELERRRGITIRTAVTSCAIDGLAVNIVDTPGHPDFIAEVERSLGVLDAAVLVLSAVEGVQPQSVVIWRALERLGVPTALFINKIDRSGADVTRVVEQARRRLSPRLAVLAMADEQGSSGAAVHAVPLLDESVVSALADVDDALLSGWVESRVSASDVTGALKQAVRRRTVTPVVCGSALTGAGMLELRRLLTAVMPTATESPGDVSGTVFAVEHDTRGRRTWIRLWSGELRVRDRVSFGDGEPELVTELAVSRPGGPQPTRSARAGEIVAIRGPVSCRIGDSLGRPPTRRTHRFPPGSLQALVEPVDPSQRTALFTALSELADEDPLIDLRFDETDAEAAVRLHGEVQQEVIAALLEERYGVRAEFRDLTIVCIERVTGVGESVDRIRVGDNPYLATIGLRLEPGLVGSGIAFSPGIERGNLPPAFIAATEEGVRTALRQGLCGWAVTDCRVTMTESGYWPRQSRPHQHFDKSVSSVAADFRNLAQVVVMAALALAGTRVCEPIDAFDLDLPAAALGAAPAILGRLGAVTTESATGPGGETTRLRGTIPARCVSELARRLPDVTGGEAVLVTTLDHHAPTPLGRPAPSRRRTGPDPRDRTGWFRDVPR